MISVKRLKDKIANNEDKKRILIVAIAIILLVLVMAKLLFSEAEGGRNDLVEMRNDSTQYNSSLQYAVETAIGDTHITKEEAGKVTELDLTDTPVVLKDFTEFRYFKNVEVIVINDSTIDSLQGIEDLKNLKELRISNSKLTDYASLNNTDLTRLSLVRCGLTGAVEIGRMSLLEELKLSDNYIESFKGDFPCLILLDLSNNEIQTIDALDIPQSTEEFNLSGNPIDSIDGLEKYDNIQKLKLNNTNIKDFSAVKEMKGLNALYIDKDDMSDDLEYLYDDFRNGDDDRKKEYISRLYDIE